LCVVKSNWKVSAVTETALRIEPVRKGCESSYPGIRADAKALRNKRLGVFRKVIDCHCS
jgi:hypothetical protein